MYKIKKSETKKKLTQSNYLFPQTWEMIIDETVAQLTILEKEREIDNVTLSGKLQEAYSHL